MARKPKLPRPKPSLGQQFKQSARKSVASGLTKNFGMLGNAIAKRYLGPSPTSSRVRNNPNSGQSPDKIIKKTKIKESTPAEVSILESSKMVKDAVEVVATNATRGFAKATREAELMGESVTHAMNDLAGLLDKMLYTRKAGPSGTGGGRNEATTTKKATDDQDNDTDIRNRGKAPRAGNPNKPKPRSKARLKKAKARYNRIYGKYRPRARFRLPGPFNLGMAGIDAYSEYQQNGNAARAGAGFAGDVAGGAAGAAAGAALGTLLFPGLGTLGGALVGMAFGTAGAIGGSMAGRYAGHSTYDALTSSPDTVPNKVTIGGGDRLIHRLTYKSTKLTFKATNSITFKSRLRQSSTTKKPKPYAGFWNKMLDKISPWGHDADAPPSKGFFNETFDKATGGVFDWSDKTGRGGGGGTTNSGTAGAAAGAGTGPTSSPTGSGVPNDILAKARDVASTGGPGAVSEFMRSQGYPQSGAWCGQFAASVIKASGGTPPQNPSIASNWRNYGQQVDTPQPGDIAVRKGAPTGSTGSHVTIVDGVDPATGKFVGLGGNQGGGRLTRAQFPIDHFTYHRGTQPTPATPEIKPPEPGPAPTAEEKAEPTRTPKTDFGLPKEGRSLSWLETTGLKNQYKDDYNALPADVKAKVDGGKPITNEDVAKIRPESQQKLRDAGVIKFGEGEFGKGAAMSGAWGERSEWNKFKKYNDMEDRRDQPQAYATLQTYKQQHEGTLSYLRNGQERFQPTPLGYALGGRDLLNYSKAPMSDNAIFAHMQEQERWDAMALKPADKPATFNERFSGEPPENRTNDNTKYQSTDNDDLDHSPKKTSVRSQSYSDYMNTTSDGEYGYM